MTFAAVASIVTGAGAVSGIGNTLAAVVAVAELMIPNVPVVSSDPEVPMPLHRIIRSAHQTVFVIEAVNANVAED